MERDVSRFRDETPTKARKGRAARGICGLVVAGSPSWRGPSFASLFIHDNDGLLA